MTQPYFRDDDSNGSCSGGSSLDSVVGVIHSTNNSISSSIRNDGISSSKDRPPPMCCWLSLPIGDNWVEIEAKDDGDEHSNNSTNELVQLPQQCSSTTNNEEESNKQTMLVEREMPLYHFLPLAARECISAAASKTMYYAHLGIVEVGTLSGLTGYPKTSDFGTFGGYCYQDDRPLDSTTTTTTSESCAASASNNKDMITADRIRLVQNLPPFSSLTWLDRQLVSEWRTISPDDLKGLIEVQNTLLKRVKPHPSFNNTTNFSTADKVKGDDQKILRNLHNNISNSKNNSADTILLKSHVEEKDDDDDDAEYTRVRTLSPPPLPRPKFALLNYCYLCSLDHENPIPFSSVHRRHHCRLCGSSICRSHGCYSHPLPELMYHPLLPERVCYICKVLLVKKDASERIAWRLC